MKSIQDKTLGMKISEVHSKNSNTDPEIDDKSIVRIEWHTKSSIAQGRPPQVQKIYKTHYDVLVKTYKNVSSTEDPSMVHFLTRLFVLLCRYDLIGDVRSRCQAIIPPMAMKAIAANFGVAHDCFASPLSNICASFNSTLFSDTDRFFGSLGSFFDLIPVEGSYHVNPPFGGERLKLLFDHIFGVLNHSDNDNSALSFLVVFRGGPDILSHMEGAHFCRRITTLQNSPKYSANMQHKDTVSASRKQVKTTPTDNSIMIECSAAWSSSTSTSLVWLQNDFGHDLWTPSDDRVGQVVQGFMA